MGNQEPLDQSNELHTGAVKEGAPIMKSRARVQEPLDAAKHEMGERTFGRAILARLLIS